MFESAIDAGASAAESWTPEAAGPGDGSRCCALCFRRFRMLVLDGPLRGLPHAVAHIVVDGVAASIRAQTAAPPAPSPADGELGSRRRAEAAGALLVVALEELGAAHGVLSDLRRRYTEPAVAEYLARHGSDDAPWIGS